MRIPISCTMLAKYTHNVIVDCTIMSQLTTHNRKSENQKIRKMSQASKGIIFHGRQSFPFHDM